MYELADRDVVHRAHMSRRRVLNLGVARTYLSRQARAKLSDVPFCHCLRPTHISRRLSRSSMLLTPRGFSQSPCLWRSFSLADDMLHRCTRHGANRYQRYCVVRYVSKWGVSPTLIADNGKRDTAKLYCAPLDFLGTRNIMPCDFHPISVQLTHRGIMGQPHVDRGVVRDGKQTTNGLERSTSSTAVYEVHVEHFKMRQVLPRVFQLVRCTWKGFIADYALSLPTVAFRPSKFSTYIHNRRRLPSPRL